MARFMTDAEILEYRRSMFLVSDAQGHVVSFDSRRPETATIEGLVDRLVSSFHGIDLEGSDSVDMVVWRDGRLVAAVYLGDNGEIRSKIFAPSTPGPSAD